MDKCAKVRELLADYRTDMLSSGKKSWAEEHLECCDECASELKMLDDVMALVAANTSELDPPEGLWNGVYNQISQPQPQKSTYNWLKRPWRIAGAAVAALVLILAVNFNPFHNGGIAPVGMISNREFIQAHSLYAAQSQFADRASYLSVVAASSDESQTK